MTEEARYILEIADEPNMRSLDISRCKSESLKGDYDGIFGDGVTNKVLDELEIRCEVVTSQACINDQVFWEMQADFELSGLAIIYEARIFRHGFSAVLGKSKLLARVASVLRPGYELRGRSPESYVDYVVEEAVRLGEKHDMTIRVLYFGYEHYVKKYLPKKPE